MVEFLTTSFVNLFRLFWWCTLGYITLIGPSVARTTRQLNPKLCSRFFNSSGVFKNDRFNPKLYRFEMDRMQIEVTGERTLFDRFFTGINSHSSFFSVPESLYVRRFSRSQNENREFALALFELVRSNPSLAKSRYSTLREHRLSKELKRCQVGATSGTGPLQSPNCRWFRYKCLGPVLSKVIEGLAKRSSLGNRVQYAKNLVYMNETWNELIKALPFRFSKVLGEGILESNWANNVLRNRKLLNQRLEAHRSNKLAMLRNLASDITRPLYSYACKEGHGINFKTTRIGQQNQNPLGLCWSYGSMQVLSSASGEELDIDCITVPPLYMVSLIPVLSSTPGPFMTGDEGGTFDQYLFDNIKKNGFCSNREVSQILLNHGVTDHLKLRDKANAIGISVDSFLAKLFRGCNRSCKLNSDWSVVKSKIPSWKGHVKAFKEGDNKGLVLALKKVKRDLREAVRQQRILKKQGLWIPTIESVSNSKGARFLLPYHPLDFSSKLLRELRVIKKRKKELQAKLNDVYEKFFRKQQEVRAAYLANVASTAFSIDRVQAIYIAIDGLPASTGVTSPIYESHGVAMVAQRHRNGRCQGLIVNSWANSKLYNGFMSDCLCFDSKNNNELAPCKEMKLSKLYGCWMNLEDIRAKKAHIIERSSVKCTPEVVPLTNPFGPTELQRDYREG